jgi:hypothetical protein
MVAAVAVVLTRTFLAFPVAREAEVVVPVVVTAAANAAVEQAAVSLHPAGQAEKLNATASICRLTSPIY